RTSTTRHNNGNVIDADILLDGIIFFTVFGDTVLPDKLTPIPGGKLTHVLLFHLFNEFRIHQRKRNANIFPVAGDFITNNATRVRLPVIGSHTLLGMTVRYRAMSVRRKRLLRKHLVFRAINPNDLLLGLTNFLTE